MDYSFLKQVKRTLEVGEKDLRRLEGGGVGKRKVVRGAGRRRALEKGVKVREAAGWMQKAGVNRTSWDNKYDDDAMV
jgi:hypothetical protein